MSDYGDIFDDDGMMEIPTMRGSANLDVQDYARPDDIDSSILDDGLQEDVPSTPGRNPGAANAPDVQGTRSWDFLEDPGGDDAMDEPGMKQTTYGDSPWGPGSDSGYRPFSQQRTDMTLRALGEADLDAIQKSKGPSIQQLDDMMREPEVIDAVPVQAAKPWGEEWHGARNQEPSNAEIDPMTIYDRTSYEYDDSSQDTIGSGIFAMEEGVTWRPRDGIFADQYALPAYIGEEDELGVQQSAMWDSTANEWRVTQPSASGVALARDVNHLKPAYSPFSRDASSPMPEMRPEVTGPRSHIEAFGRHASKTILDESRGYRPQDRSKFLQGAIEALGPGTTERCRKAADALIKMGYRSDIALEDALAHCVMHAAVLDLTQKKRGRTLLPRLDSMAKRVGRGGQRLRAAAQEHIQPLVRDRGKLRNDVGALYASPAARGMGAVKNGGDDKTGPYTSDLEIPGGPASKNGGGLFRPRNLAIAGALGVGGYLLWTNRKAIKKNVKKLLK